MHPHCLVASTSHAPSLRIDDSCSSGDRQGQEPPQSENLPPAPTMWFPLNENISSSWPPKITFGVPPASPPREKSARSSRVPPDVMEGIVPAHSQSTHTRSATRPIPNRASRSNSLSVPATPPSLWRRVSDPKDREAFGADGLGGHGRCAQAPIGSERVRPSSSSLVDLGTKLLPRACPPRLDAPRATRSSPPALPPNGHTTSLTAAPISGAPGFRESVLTQWGQHERKFLRLWSAQKRRNPHLPRLVSPFNPLRAFMPPLYWKTIATKRPFQKVEWNCKKPLPSPDLRPRLRSRKVCDAAAEHLSAKAFLAGKLRHCRACTQDPLWKRLLIFNHWVSRDDQLFEAALSGGDDDDSDSEMGDGVVANQWDDGLPADCVFLRDRDDFDDEDDGAMDDVPLIEGHHGGYYPLRLF